MHAILLKHGAAILFFVGLAAMIGGAAGASASSALIAAGAALVVFGVVLPRMDGAFEALGVKGTLRSREELLREVEAGAERRGLSDAETQQTLDIVEEAIPIIAIRGSDYGTFSD